MNCHDITRLLDEGDIGRMTERERSEVEAHLSACPDCAADWKIHSRLVAGFAPPMPAGLTERARALVVAGVGAQARRASRRAILFGTLLAVAAAAALLGLWLNKPAKMHPVVQSPEPPVQTSEIALPEASPAVQPVAAAEPRPSAPLPGKHTVRVPPVKIEGNDATGNALAQRFREQFIAKLRAVPGLAVVDSGAEYEIRMTYSSAQVVSGARMLKVDPATAEYFATVDAAAAAEAKMDYADQQRSRQVRQREETQRLRASMGQPSEFRLLVGLGFPASVILDSPNVPLPGDRIDYAATKLVRDLRVKFLPLDAALEAELLAMLRDSKMGQDSSQNEGIRMFALGDLLSIAQRRGGLRTADAAVVRAGGELALVFREKTGRRMIWSALASTRNPEVLPYLVRGLDVVTDAETRLQIVKILTDDFGDDPRARDALQAMSRPDVRQSLRIAELRASGDESKWKDFVVATLADPSLPDLLRLQPIAEMTPVNFNTFSAASGTALSKLQLNDQAIRELGTLIIKASLDTSADDATRNAARRAAQGLGAFEGPAVLDALIAIMKAPDNTRPGIREESVNSIKTYAMVWIAEKFHSNPQARAAMQALASDPASSSAASASQLLQGMAMKANLERLGNQQGLQAPNAPR
jgi:hypothetical protein